MAGSIRIITQSGLAATACEVRRFVAGIWSMLRHVSGDDAYELYLEHFAEYHPGDSPINCAEFHRLRIEKKWRGVSRCC